MKILVINAGSSSVKYLLKEYDDGQSNMLGMGHIAGDSDGTLEYAVKTKGLYRYLVNDDDGSWSTSDSVRNVRVMSSGNGDMHISQ